MKEFDFGKFDLKQIYKRRQQEVSSFLKQLGAFCVVFEDSENQRTQDIRYLSGHISDAILVIFASGDSILCPWDMNLAKMNSTADKIIALTDYDCSHTKALEAILKAHCQNCLQSSNPPTVFLSPVTSYIEYEKRKQKLKDFHLVCEEQGVHQKVQQMRLIKDEFEIACMRCSCQIADCLIEQIQDSLHKQKIKTESDVALMIEKSLRNMGAESTSFDTLVAGGKRSFAIHAFPCYTKGLWGNEGLSILDFGTRFFGYCSDVTLTVAKEPLTKEQKHLVDLVENARDIGLECYRPGSSLQQAACKVNEYFLQNGKSMPHSLGHGIGLDIHEAPFVRHTAKKDFTFSPGQIVTLEPGLYDEKLGGTRVENDVLITQDGNEVLTHSRVIWL